jgi:hypothetical protein
MSKNKGGREIRKPKQPKKPKITAAVSTVEKINGPINKGK